MDYVLQRALMIAAGVVVALIIISVVVFVYDEIIKIYTTVDKVDASILNIEDEFVKYEDNIMRGVEILNTIKLYKQDKERMVISFNLVRNGTLIEINRTHNWDTYINYFTGANTSYVDALSKTYTTAKTTLADNRIKITFTCNN